MLSTDVGAHDFKYPLPLFHIMKFVLSEHDGHVVFEFVNNLLRNSLTTVIHFEYYMPFVVEKNKYFDVKGWHSICEPSVELHAGCDRKQYLF